MYDPKGEKGDADTGAFGLLPIVVPNVGVGVAEVLSDLAAVLSMASI